MFDNKGNPYWATEIIFQPFNTYIVTDWMCRDSRYIPPQRHLLSWTSMALPSPRENWWDTTLKHPASIKNEADSIWFLMASQKNEPDLWNYWHQSGDEIQKVITYSPIFINNICGRRIIFQSFAHLLPILSQHKAIADEILKCWLIKQCCCQHHQCVEPANCTHTLHLSAWLWSPILPLG